MALINKNQEYQGPEDWSNGVQKLKGYKEFKEKVEYWNNRKDYYGISVIMGPYEIVYDNELGWCVDVLDEVSFYGLNIKEIPFQFRNVSGYFNCYGCKKLKSLKGCPIYVGGNFSCRCCENLTSLKGCPKEVNGSFYCKYCVGCFSKEYVNSLCNVKENIYN